MRFIILSVACFALFAPFARAEFEEDFQLEETREKRSPDYGGGLGGPLAAGIREHKSDKDDDNSTMKPYIAEANINNKKKCDVVRLRKQPDSGKGPEAEKARASKEFDEYVKKYKKTYANAEAKERARQNFIDGKSGAHNLNRNRCSNTDAQFANTKYSDWSTTEFVQKLAGAREDSEPSKLPPAYAVTENESRFLWKLPRLDWRKYEVFPSVRDQLECGGCYSFSTTDLLAAQEKIDQNKLNSGTVEPYSAQYFIDCMPQPYGYGCKGGRPAAVLEYMSSCKDCQILLERCYEYRNKHVLCQQPSINCRGFVGAKPVFSKQVNLISKREAETMATLLRWGPLVAVVELGPAWQYYNGTGIMREDHCGKKPNHAILIVGYDYTGDVPYYIVRNSWSDDWGAEGYIKIEAGKNTCGIATAVLAACTDEEKCGSFKEIQDFARNPHIRPELKPDGTIVKS